MPDVFLSYSREDQATAHRFADALTREGFTVWWDQTLHSGEAYDQVTEAALREAKAVVVLWSKASVDSRWVRAEATTADRIGTLVPVMIEPCNRPIMFELTHTADLSQWKGDTGDRAWRAYVVDVRRAIERREASTSQSLPAAANPYAAPAVAPAAGNARPGRLRIAIALVALLLVAGGVWALLNKKAPNAAGAVAQQATASAPVTLAVLPFADLSAAKDQEYFSDGLTEEILNELAQVPQLRVTGRTSSFSFKGKNEDLREIGRQLGVAHLLEGSIRKDGNQLRITAQLIDSRDGAHQWSHIYEREVAGVFKLQEEIAKDVAQALSITLDIGAMSRAQGGTTNVEAYDRFLRGRKLILQGGREAALQAAELLREAVKLDPQFARGWLALSDALGSASLTTPEAQSQSMVKEANEAMARITALAPDSVAAQSVRVRELLAQRKWAEADALTTRVIKSTPLTAENLVELAGGAGIFAATGRIDEVIRQVRQAQQLEPLSLAISTDLQRFLYAAGQFDAAQAENERSKSLTGDQSRPRGRALLLELRREPMDPQKVKALIGSGTRDEGLGLPRMASLAQVAGDRKAMQAIVRQEFADPANGGATQTTLILMLADALGDRELALSALERLFQQDSFYMGLWIAPNSGLRTDPGFKALLRKLGLVDYFRSSGNWGDFCRPVGADDFECR